jgi:hypothetical protein
MMRSPLAERKWQAVASEGLLGGTDAIEHPAHHEYA